MSLQKLIALERRTARIGFDWPNADSIIDQVISECDEIRQAVKNNEGPVRLQEEIGDLIHATISLCFFSDFDIEETLSIVSQKFEKRLNALETIMKERGYETLKGETFDVLLDLWDEAKREGDTISVSSV